MSSLQSSSQGVAGKTPSLAVQLGALGLRNPVLAASGTFGYGEEMAAFYDLSQIGGIVCKTVTHAPRAGNPTPRACETRSGMLNAIGLQNVGIARFITDKLPFLKQLGTKIIVNIAGETAEEFAELAAMLVEEKGVDALELNISCPNVAHGLDFAVDPRLTEQVVSGVLRAVEGSALPVIVKLSPNVTDIAQIAVAAEQGGAHALSLVNTFVGMAINARTRRPRLSNISGGLSGPAIKPLALRAVYRCAQRVRIPLIGIGGIASGEDAAEFLLAGASAVQVGTANFVYPDAALRVLRELEEFLEVEGIADVRELVGGLRVENG
jgi:dihydroorotate dehydrogenase (NAD+) catalytic subunit